MSEVKKSVNLPDLPSGTEFEEYVAAYFQCAGYFVERNIIERDAGTDILELDVILSDYNVSPPAIYLVEVKSGDWGFSDLFKVYGWMHYLNVKDGLFVSMKDRSNLDFVKEKAKDVLQIKLAILIDLAETRMTLSELGFRQIEFVDDKDIRMWRFSYWTERSMLRMLKNKKKSNPEKKAYFALDSYYHEINNETFFTGTIAEKIYNLYGIFERNYYHMSARCGNELLGNDFNGDYEGVPKPIFADTYHKCKYTDIQISTYVEHRARLAILKNGIDYLLYKEAGKHDKADYIFKILGHEINYMDSLPVTFKDGLDKLRKHKYYYRYPVFWQWYMWIFGGFILNDYKDREYEILSEQTGVPIDEIPNALKAFDILFPIAGGWLQQLPESNITFTKMFPVPFMGIGANYRRFLYTASKKFEQLTLTGLHTRHDLLKWNDLVVEVLSKK